MKQILYLFVLILFSISCQDNLQNPKEAQLDNVSISLRDVDDCEQNFTPGNVWGNLLGTEPTHNFDEPGWNGSFEQEFFPCPMLNEDEDCCNDVVTINFGRLDDLPFETTCNKDLDAQELQLLADHIMSLATEELPACEGQILNPVAVNVILNFTTCCVENTPCFWLENPCDCYEDFPSPFWGCCEGYVLQLEVKYARTTSCIPAITDFTG